MRPLADILRPKNLDEFCGQEHILGPGKILRKMVESDCIRSIILYGPPGTGKTTLARIIASTTGSKFRELNSTTSGIKDARKIIMEAEICLKDHKKKTIIFIDEIYRWSSNQQDALLPHVESGTIILIGATTQNPYFSINGPLLSRSEIFEFKYFNKKDLLKILKRIIDYYRSGNKSISIHRDEIELLLERVGGDARKLSNAIEILVDIDNGNITKEKIIELLPQKHVIFGDDEHFDGMSALQGSIQASDPHSAVYWLAWCINHGEDINVVCRRMLVTAAEDVGLCDPQCLPYVVNAVTAAQQVGFPEAAIILSSAVAYMAMSLRSKASARAIWEALKLEKEASKQIPDSIKDCHYKGATKLGRGSTYDGKNLDEYKPIIKDLFRPENGKEVNMMKINDGYWSENEKDL